MGAIHRFAKKKIVLLNTVKKAKFVVQTEAYE
jgi:hypothetical protein